MSYLRNYTPASTPQSQPLPGSAQVANSAGGYVWKVDPWTRLRRFLILGTEGGSYYASERAMTTKQIEALVECLREDGEQVVEMIAEISWEGLAPKNDQAIFALAYALSEGDLATKKAAELALPLVCRTGTHLFMCAEFIEGLSGWGRAKRRAFASWYEGKTPEQLSYQLVKYRQRNGWTHRDILRLSHPNPGADNAKKALYTFATGKEIPEAIEGGGNHYTLIDGFLLAQTAPKPNPAIIRDHGLPREALPTEWLTDPAVWEALLQDMPMTAMIRNLPTMTRLGLLAMGSDATRLVCERLADPERLRKGRIHPMQILLALRTYAAGHSLRGKGTWTPVARISDALDSAFYLSFQNVEPSGKRHLLALDVSGSMGSGMVAGVPGFTPREAAAAMALITASVEPDYLIISFEHRVRHIDITKGMRLQDAMTRMREWDGAGTDCALPMLFAMEKNIAADVFVAYTDSETWFGGVHPSEALKTYRQRSGIDARLAVFGMVANEFTIADPNDPGMLDLVGFDASAPRLLADFAAGRI